MKYVKKFSFLFIALVFITLGTWLIFQAGIPGRADYTGSIVDNVGYVAPEINNRAPSFSLNTVNSNEISLNDLFGKAVIINFWATWCIPCRTEMPELQDLYDQFDGNIRILGINQGENPQHVAQWMNDFKLTFDILLDPMRTVTQLYQIRGQPSTYVLDSNHVIRAIYYGPVSKEQLEQDITAIQN